MLFAGRPDPAWPVPAGAVRELEAIWKRLTPVSEAPASAATLGYRGCSLSDRKGRTWHAYHGMVTLAEPGSSESRRDPERTFETMLLGSAPAGVIPVGFLDEATRAALLKRR